MFYAIIMDDTLTLWDVCKESLDLSIIQTNQWKYSITLNLKCYYKNTSFLDFEIFKEEGDPRTILWRPFFKITDISHFHVHIFPRIMSDICGRKSWNLRPFGSLNFHLDLRILRKPSQNTKGRYGNAAIQRNFWEVSDSKSSKEHGKSADHYSTGSRLGCVSGNGFLMATTRVNEVWVIPSTITKQTPTNVYQGMEGLAELAGIFI